MATNTHDADIGALPDKLLLDILARLSDPVDLLRCAATCVRWLLLLSAGDAALLRQAGVLLENRNGNSTLLLGAFYQNDHGVVPGSMATEKTSDHSPQFWRLHRLPPDSFRSGFIFPKNEWLFNYAKPLASRHGLLLVRLMPAPLDYQKLHLAVCHPILGGVHHVPPPPVVLHPEFLGRDVTGYSLITGYGGEGLDNKRQQRLAFRVLFTAVRLDKNVCAYSYSSATRKWSVPTMCPPLMQDLTMSGPRAGVVDADGTTHWLYRDRRSYYTLDVSADAARVSLIKIPMQVHLELQPPFPYIARGGRVSFLYTRPEGHHTLQQLWTRQDEDNIGGGWQCSELGLIQWPYHPVKIIGFAESRGAILISVTSWLSGTSWLISFDIESWETELVRNSAYPTKVCPNMTCKGYDSCTECSYNNCVVYEVDWSTYLLHLSAWNLRGTC